GFNTDVMSYLFGNILTVRVDEVIVIALLALGVLGMVMHYYRVLFATTFDEEYARTLGINTQAVNAMLVTFTALTVALCIKVIGAFLISAVLIIPAVTALQLGASFKRTLIYSVCFALFSMMGGIMLSLLTNSPTGATIVLVHVATLGAVLTVMRLR
ncbi:MAG TPA: metal ABC transporter permease, partial [Candidatus Woesebacteria bacterium]|nr:metal ABC transporter permease [Candidatus Woesebacteria bacterium]